MFTVIPAIDLRDGQVVRLLQGDYDYQTNYDVTPQALAQQYQAAGAAWIHMVDLDGARSGNQTNLDVIAAIAGAGINIQAGGGVRTSKGLESLFDAGVGRAVVGSVAVREPETVKAWLARYGAERITLALDARFHKGAWQLATAGWTRRENIFMDDLARFYADAGAKHVLCTDINRDGAMAGPNIELYEHWAESYPTLDVQASGGVRDAADIDAVKASKVAGVILGRSLLEGHLDLHEALQRST